MTVIERTVYKPSAQAHMACQYRSEFTTNTADEDKLYLDRIKKVLVISVDKKPNVQALSH
jgi:hypothetical protein